MDELAVQADTDPVEFRLKLLAEADVVEQKFLPWVGDDLYPAKLKRTLEVAAENAKLGQCSRRNLSRGLRHFLQYLLLQHGGGCFH